MSEKYETHPRTIIHRDEVPAFRLKIQQAPYAQMLEQSRKSAARHAHDEEWIADGRLMRMYAEIYLASGDPHFAALAKIALERFMEDKNHILSNPMAKGLTRATYLLHLAQTYDFCAAVWDDETCEKADALIYQLAYGLSASLGDGGNYHVANNWNGVRYGAIHYAAYASDQEDARHLLWESRTHLREYLKANLGENGWNPEGIAYVTYPWIFMAPALITAKKYGHDYLVDMPAARYTYLAALFGVVPIEMANGALGFHADLSDDNTEFDSRGTLASAFALVEEEYQSALRWMFDHLRGNEGDQTWDGGEFGWINAMLFYPEETEGKNPSETMGLTYTDLSQGILLMRNRFQDENDIVAIACAASRRPRGAHNGPDTGAIRLLGLGNLWITGSGRTDDPDGQSILFPKEKVNGLKFDRDAILGQITAHGTSHDGSGWAFMRGSCVGVQNHVRRVAVDYSRASGAEALLVLADTSDNGGHWRINTLEMNRITPGSDGFTITAPNGASLKVVLFDVSEDALADPKTGNFERGRAGDIAVQFKNKNLRYNNWIEYRVNGNVTAVMTLVPAHTEHPTVSRTDGIYRIGTQTVRVRADQFIFGK